MKKIIFTLVLITFMLSSLSACKTNAPGTEKPSTTQSSQTQQGTQQGIVTNQIMFETIKSTETLPQDIQKSILALSQKRGYAFFADNGEYIIFVGLGEKPTGGYAIEVKRIEDVEGITKILVEEIEPGVDDVVTQALTYPYTIVRAKGITENFEVVNQKGESFSLLVTEKPVDKVVTFDAIGIYNGQIDGNSIEISVDGQPAAFRHEQQEDMKALVEKLETGTEVEFSYYKNENGQQILTYLDIKTK